MNLRRAMAVVAGLALSLGVAAPTLGQSAPIASFAPATASFVFGTSITFSDTLDLSIAPKRVELLLSEPGSIGPVRPRRRLGL